MTITESQKHKAKEQYQLLQAYVKAGFSRDEAIRLVIESNIKIVKLQGDIGTNGKSAYY